MSVVIVGNGTSVLDADYGEAIDAHAIVLRFNSYIINGFERHVGTKTDIWLTCLQYRSADSRVHRPYTKVWTLSWQFDPAQDKQFQKYQQGFAAFDPPVPVEKVSKVTHDEMIAFASDLDGYGSFSSDLDGYVSFSSGLFAIWLMLKEHDHVALVGFDWWDRRKHHYAGDHESRGLLHKPALEYRFIEKLMNEGKVSFLALADEEALDDQMEMAGCHD